MISIIFCLCYDASVVSYTIDTRVLKMAMFTLKKIFFFFFPLLKMYLFTHVGSYFSVNRWSLF